MPATYPVQSTSHASDCHFITVLTFITSILARTVVKAPKSSHITPILRSLHWLKINERIEYKLLSLTLQSSHNQPT